MRVAVRVAAVLAAASALAACTSKTAPSTGALLDEPSSVAVFRGVTTKHGFDPANPSRPYSPHIAVANAGANDVSIVDGVDDSLVAAPIPLRGLVYPLPGRPALLASGDLGDLKPDLLVAVSAGDSRLQIIRTWKADGAVVGEVDLGADVLAVAALAPDPGAPGAVQMVAALAGERVAVVTFSRTAGGDDAIDVAAAQASVRSGAVGFQPVALAVTPGSRTRVWAATPDDLGGGVHGVAGIDVGATPALAQVLDAGAPTRLVAAARLATWVAPADPELLGTAGFAGRPVEERVYAALDDGITGTGRPGCGVQAPIACGVVALDPATGTLTLDPTPAGSMHAPFAAPIQAGRVLALGASGPPAVAPAADPSFAGTYLRIPTSVGTRVTTGAGAIATVDGFVYVVDLGRWDVPAQQSVVASVKAKVTPVRAPGSSVNQWLVLEGTPGGPGVPAVPVPHTDPTSLSTHTVVTAGYTPTDLWTVTNEGVLPSLLTRRAEAGDAGGGVPWLAMQARVGGTAFEVVRLYDPTLGVHARDALRLGETVGDTAVIDATGLGTCTTFEAEVDTILPPDAANYPGGALRLRKKVPTNAAWDACVDALVAPHPSASLRATVRAGGYVLVRGTGEFAVHVGRPLLGQPVGKPFEVRWEDEVALAAQCPLPPSVPWPAVVPACDPVTCRKACEDLQRARLARRVGYLSEAPVALTGPALAFTLALETVAAAPRDLALVFETVDGRVPFRVFPTAGSGTDPRAILPFDRSPWVAEAGVRFLVPYSSGIVLDLTPTQPSGGPATVH